LTVFAALVPIAASVVATRLAARIVPRPHGLGASILWWVTILAVATIVVVGIERVTRRLAPLAALLKLSLAFPDRAPSRFSVALRSGTVRQLQSRYEAVKRDGLGATPTEAAHTVVELIGALNAHDRLTRGHCERVRAYTALIAEELKLPEDEVDRLRWAGLLHDLGKLEVPAEILNKKGALTEEEWEIVKTHPAAGARIAAPLAGWLGDAFRAIGEHHERWDGRGYPGGLAGEDIALGARIVAVADAFDVMTAARSYKSPKAPSWARAELVRCAGSQFDPVVVRAFLNVSLGKLRWTIGPLSWLAQLPMLAQGPIASATGTVATTAMAATIAVGASAVVGLPAAANPSRTNAAVVSYQEPMVSADALTRVPGVLVTTPVTVPAVVATTTTVAATTTSLADGTTTVAPSTTTAPTTASTAPPKTAPTVAPTTPKTTSPTTPKTAAPPTATTAVAPTPTTAAASTATTTPTTQPITAPPQNVAPSAVDDSGSIRPVQLSAINIKVLDNDTDSDGDTLSIFSFTQPPSGGSVTRHSSGKSLDYTALLGQPVTFTYTIDDGHGHYATATVTITVS
jgi:hypothetical protein